MNSLIGTAFYGPVLKRQIGDFAYANILFGEGHLQLFKNYGDENSASL